MSFGGFPAITPARVSRAAPEEFRVMLGDFGEPVTAGGVTKQAIITVDEQVIEGENAFAGGAAQKRGEVIGREIVALVLTRDFPDGTLEIDAPFSIDAGEFAGSYRIRNAKAQKNGLGVTEISLREA